MSMMSSSAKSFASSVSSAPSRSTSGSASGAVSVQLVDGNQRKLFKRFLNQRCAIVKRKQERAVKILGLIESELDAIHSIEARI